MADNNHKIIFLGDSSVGKTSIINQYFYKSITTEYSATIGLDFLAKSVKVDNKNIRLQIWDTAGQEKFNSLIPSYIRTSTIGVICYDITNRTTFESLDRWLKMVTDLADPVLFIVGNKTDLYERNVFRARSMSQRLSTCLACQGPGSEHCHCKNI